MRRKIDIYDTTLQNSPEWPAHHLTADNPGVIARRLDALGVDYIEIGSGPENSIPYRELLEEGLSHARLTTAVRLPEDAEALSRKDWAASLHSPATPTYTLIVNQSAAQTSVSKTSVDAYFEALGAAIRHFLALEREVLIEIEDFFEGYKRSADQMKKLVTSADAAGAHRLILNETSGQTLPWEAGTIIHEMVSAFPKVKFGVHFHDLGHSAVAGALTAVDQGVVHVQGSINGFGRRSGEANLCNIIPDLELKMGYVCLPEGNLPGLLDVAQLLMGSSSESTESGMRYVGRSELNPI
ncbi:MAG: hypothetical protein R3335_09915 [Anaerolineales bacterium]|nr:hypothetical protein [Anaerolineales bacterium]